MKYNVVLSTVENRMCLRELHGSYHDYDTAIRLYRLIVDDIKNTDGYNGTEISLRRDDGLCIECFFKE